MGNPIKNAKVQEQTITQTRFVRSHGISSRTAEIIASQDPHTEEIAKRHSIKKNMNENNGLIAIALTASGYTMKAKPGPASTTSSIGIPFLLAMKPTVPKTTSPKTMIHYIFDIVYRKVELL